MYCEELARQAAHRPGGRCRWAGALVLACLLGVGQAWGQALPEDGPQDEDEVDARPAGRAVDTDVSAAQPPAPDTLAILGAVVPGILVHGTGHRIAGDRRTANRLLLFEGIGLGAMIAAAVPLGLTGASRRLSLPAIPVLVGGSGLFILGWAADIYGAAGGPRIAGAPRLRLPGLETRLGYLFVHDPQFAYTHFADLGAGLRRGAWHAFGSAQLALDDDNQRVRAALAHRFSGPRAAGPPARDGSFLDVQAALGWHRFGPEDFATTTVEAFAGGRYDLARLSPTLGGAFAEMGFGLGLEIIDYPASGADVADLLLARFGFGMYLGVPAGMHGEVRLAYDHRRDGLAGGLALPMGSGGFLGSVDLDGSLMFGSGWGVAMQAQLGSAYLVGTSLVYRRR